MLSSIIPVLHMGKLSLQRSSVAQGLEMAELQWESRLEDTSSAIVVGIGELQLGQQVVVGQPWELSLPEGGSERSFASVHLS